MNRMAAYGGFFLILATMACVYGPILASDFAFSDDYWVLATRPLSDTHLVGSVVRMVSNDGRFLQPWWLINVMGHFSGIQPLRYV